MNVKFINFLYWFITTTELVFLKILTYSFGIDNIIFNSFFRSITLPYYIYKLVKYQMKHKDIIINAKWYDILNGIFDQLDIILSYIAYYGLTIGEYITYRTFSVVLGGIYLMIYNKKILSLQKLSSISLIFTASILLLSFSKSFSNHNIFYSFVCVLSSVAYSLSSFLIEVNIKTKKDQNLNFYWTKTISYIIALFVGFISEYTYQSITGIINLFSGKNIILIVTLEILVALLENFYYYLKIKCISIQNKDGSIIVQFLDILRRFVLIIIGIIFFSEVYTTIIYISTTLMFIGSIIGLLNFENIIYLYHKYIKKASPTNYNVNFPQIEKV